MDLLNMARTARENLARGLNALQSPGVPPSLMSVAEPIAQAMGCMHRIEASRGNDLLEPAQTALGLARRALSELQAQAVPHPAVDQAVEAVASSLGVIHQLTQAAPQHVSPPTQPSNALHYGAREPQPQVAIVGAPGAYPPAPQQHWQQPAPAPQPVAQQHWQQPAPAPQPVAQQHWQQPSAPAAPVPQQHWQQPAAAPAPEQHWQQPAPAPQPAAQQHWQQPAAPAAQPGWQAQTVPSGTDPKGTLRFDAELGAHSATNFYKGLSGNDVIDSGGLFIATYQIPEIGRTVQLKVSLPGGYEFEALGVVRWTREAPESGAGDSAPGFGVQFTQISPEGRQLVYRYARNREPIFHDDL